jgi:hypothetical protein
MYVNERCLCKRTRDFGHEAIGWLELFGVLRARVGVLRSVYDFTLA